MNRSRSVGIALVLASVCALVLAGCQNSQVSQLQSELNSTKTQLAQSQQQVSQLQQQLTAAQAASATAAASGSATSAPAPAVKPKAPVSFKQFAYVKKAAKPGGSAILVTVDYAEYLTGKAAAAAATAHGDESPPPNDYYIVNDNHLLRKFPVKPGISVSVVVNPDGTSDPSGHLMPLSKWYAVFNGSANPDQQMELKAGGYWLTVKNGTVVAMKQQYTP